MASSPKVKTEAVIPFWRDVRVLGVIAQIIFMTAVVIGVGWFIRNFLINAEAQGLKIGFDFLNITAAFDIKEGIAYQNTDHFGRALWVGIANTIRVSLIGCTLTTFLGTIIGISRLSNNWLISKMATVYVEIIRNTPLLVQYFLFISVSLFRCPPSKKPFNPLAGPYS